MDGFPGEVVSKSKPGLATKENGGTALRDKGKGHSSRARGETRLAATIGKGVNFKSGCCRRQGREA